MNRDIMKRAGLAMGAALAIGAGTAWATPLVELSNNEGSKWVFEHKVPAAPKVAPLAPRAPQVTQEFSIITTENDEKYEVVVSDGEVVARVNGLMLSPDRIVENDGEVILLDNAGKEMKVISIGPRAPKVQSLPGVIFDVNVEEMEHPPVMLGVLLESPGKALSMHLDLPEHAMMLEKVMDGLAAQRAGLQAFDIVIEVNGEMMDEEGVLHHALMESSPGDEMEVVVIRRGEEMEIDIELTAYNAEKLGQRTLTVESKFPQHKAEGNIARFFSQGAGQQGIETARKSLEEAMRAMEIERGIGASEMAQAKREIERAIRQLETQRGPAAAALRAWRLDDSGRLLHHDGGEHEEEMLEELEGAFEDRLEHLEESFEERMEAMEDRWDELEDMLDEMFDRIEERLDRAFEERRRRNRE